MHKHVFGLAIALMLAATPASADFAYEDYVPSTLQAAYAIGENECGPLEENTMALVAGKKAFRVPATWNGETRPANRSIATILEMGMQRRDLFKTEVRVSHAGRDFWVPIQEQILQYFKDEVGPVKKVRLYIMYWGCIAKKPAPLVAVSINEFEAGKD